MCKVHLLKIIYSRCLTTFSAGSVQEKLIIVVYAEFKHLKVNSCSTKFACNITYIFVVEIYPALQPCTIPKLLPFKFILFYVFLYLVQLIKALEQWTPNFLVVFASKWLSVSCRANHISPKVINLFCSVLIGFVLGILWSAFYMY